MNDLKSQEPLIEKWLSTPFVSGLTTQSNQSKVLFLKNEAGKKTIYKADAPTYDVSPIASFLEDDGLEITSITLSPDGKWAAFVRGGEHSGNSAVRAGNPASFTTRQQIILHVVNLQSGEKHVAGEGDYPVFHPSSAHVTFIRGGQAWTHDLASKKSNQLFSVSGNVGSISWSPDGNKLLFVSSRSGHSFIGIYAEGAERIQWVAPSFHRDRNPKWSPDGQSVAFVRTKATGGALSPILEPQHQPWQIMVASTESSQVRQIWKAPETLPGSVPSWQGSFNLAWPLANKIVFLSYQDGWPHLYTVSPQGDQFAQLTKGNYTVDQMSYSGDGSKLLFAANTGPDLHDLERKHIGVIHLHDNRVEFLTSGKGIEAYPQFIDNDQSVAFLSSTLERPYLPAILTMDQKQSTWNIVGEHLMSGYDHSNHVVPEHVRFLSEDGLEIYGQLFRPKNAAAQAPGLVYIHGGPRRQMFLGWHFLDYYFYDYILNQYLASKGFVVLAINYRMGTGYGYDFQTPANAGTLGASEYLDILASGKWLQNQPFVDETRIGVHGGSYGGYLTAMALGRNSDIFKVGVDIHGVHNRSRNLNLSAFPPDFEEAAALAWESSPSKYVDTWRSPVLIVHSDDDQNVAFSQSIDLFNRLEEKGVEMEIIAIPDDNHHWMLFENLVRVKQATADFLEKHLIK